MGLDIYLYAKVEQDACTAYEEASTAFYERPDYEQLTEDERKAEYAKMPSWSGNTDVPSRQYPDHLFNRRYLRSSYNSGGFDRAVPDMVGADHGLYWIFEPVRGGTDEYEFEMTAASIPALEQARARAMQVRQELRLCDPLRVDTAYAMVGTANHLWQQLPYKGAVLQWYRDEKELRATSESDFRDASYSNAKGTVLGFTKGMEVLAVTTGRDILGQIVAMVVYRVSPEVLDSYIQSAEITAEFCDEAIDLIQQDGVAFLHWSS